MTTHANTQLRLFDADAEPPRSLAELDLQVRQLELAYDTLLSANRAGLTWDIAEQRWYPIGFDPVQAGIAQHLNQLLAQQEALQLHGITLIEDGCGQ